MSIDTQPAPTQGNQDQEIQDFYHFVERERQQGIRISDDQSPSLCPFGFSYAAWIPVPKLREYLTTSKIAQILRSIYGRRTRLPVDETHIHKSYLKIFAILLLIKKGNYIQYFAENTLRDNSLPYTSRPDNFPNLAGTPDDFWPDFNRVQWQLSAHCFERVHVNTRLHKNIILPIIEWEMLVERGDSGTILKVRIHPDYHELREDEDQPLPQASYDPNCFVIKSFDASSPRHLTYYDSEIDAFKTLQCNTRHAPREIVGFYGSFIQNGTHNILLEFADAGTLEQYFKTQPPPDEPEDIISFWTSMKDLAKGLARLHTDEISTNEGANEIFYGYHQDLKPSNILVFTYGVDSPYRYRFKIADLGLSHFVQARYPISDVNGQGDPGTRTFGSPENYRAREIDPRKIKYPQKSDVWSFACICSIAASWVVGGQARIDRYSRARQKARDEANVASSDCFHNDSEVLSIVQEWHEKTLVGMARKSDYITGRLWQSVLRRAFSENIADRLWADQLHHDMVALIKPPNPQSPPQTPPDQIHESWSTLYEEPQEIGEVVLPRPPYTNNRSTRSRRHTTRTGYDSPPRTDPLWSSVDQDYTQPSPQNFTESSPRDPVYSTTQSSPEGFAPRAYERNSMPPIQPGGDGRMTHTIHQCDLARSTQLQESTQPSNTRKIPSRTQSQSQVVGLNISERSDVLSYVPKYFQDSQKKGRIIGVGTFAEGSTGSAQAATVTLDTRNHTKFSRPSEPYHRSQPSAGKSWSDGLPGTSETEQTTSRTPEQSEKGMICPRHGSHGQEIEYMSVQDLVEWYHKKKEVPHAGLKEDLKCRDHVFVIDDSLSMLPYWSEVVELFAVLAKFIKDCDDDGIELFFTRSRHDRMKEKHTTGLINKVKSLKGTIDASSEPDTVLREIFDEDRKKVLREGKRKKWSLSSTTKGAPLTIYILTDGVWQRESNLRPIIEEVVEFLEKHHAKRPKHVGIQFIQFGKNPELTLKLKAYDDMKLARDIVDHEPSDGNAWKMLLGSVNTSFDKADADCICNFDAVAHRS